MNRALSVKVFITIAALLFLCSASYGLSPETPSTSVPETPSTSVMEGEAGNVPENGGPLFMEHFPIDSDPVFPWLQQKEPTLEDAYWTLEAYGYDDDPIAASDEYPITAVFDPEEGTVSGRAACNLYFAGYEIDGDTLSISEIGSTLMYCNEPAMELEQMFLSALMTAKSYAVEDGRLTVTTDDGRLLIFSSGESEDAD